MYLGPIKDVMEKSSFLRCFLEVFEMSQSYLAMQQGIPTIILKDIQLSSTLKYFNTLLKVSKTLLLATTFQGP